MLVSHSDKIVKVFGHIVSTRALGSNTNCDNVQYDESKEVGAMSRERIHVFCLVRAVWGTKDCGHEEVLRGETKWKFI